MRALVLGASGMLGHTVTRVFAERCETSATVRSASPPALNGGNSLRVLTGVSAENFDSVVRAVAETRPAVVVNCIGIVKQLSASRNAVLSISVNALFPHKLAALTRAASARLIQVSTDCVFSGRRGGYSEDDEPDPVDLYGRTKLLGEVDQEHALTVRTSIIGRELSGATGLLEWFLTQTGHVRGYTGARFSGLTTTVLAETLAEVAEHHRSLHGIWHVASEPIAKYDLLVALGRAFDRSIEIEPDDSVRIDRSLDDTRFRDATGIRRPSWPEMVAALAREAAGYDQLRAAAC